MRSVQLALKRPVQSAEPSGQSGWLVLTIGVLLRGQPKRVASQASELHKRVFGITPFDAPVISAALVLVAGLAVLAARRASRRLRAGHAA